MRAAHADGGLGASISWPSSVARSSVGKPSRAASTRSGLSGKTATVYTKSSAPRTFSALWPMVTGTPCPRSSRVAFVSRLSLPVSTQPWATSIRASPLMLLPPMPTMCTRLPK